MVLSGEGDECDLDAGNSATAVQWEPRPRFRRMVAKFIAIVVAALIPWTIYLALALPPRYDARHWTLVWVGFDTVLMGVLAHAAWAMWFRRQVMVATALVAGTLLLCDAWFDVMTSFGGRDELITLLTAFAGEIPAAMFFFFVAHRGMVGTVRTVHELSGASGPPPKLRSAGSFSVLNARPVVSRTTPAAEPDTET